MEARKAYADNLTLLERSRAGDEEATEALLVANGGLVRNIAARFCDIDGSEERLEL